jgi:hypothetical protein
MYGRVSGRPAEHGRALPHDECWRVGQSRRSPFIRRAAAARRFAVIRDAAQSNVGFLERRTSLDDPYAQVATMCRWSVADDVDPSVAKRWQGERLKIWT